MSTRLVILALTAALLSGCGGYSASPAGNGGRLTKVEWIQAADEICSRSKAEISDLPRPESPSALVIQLDSLIRIFSREVDDLMTLTPQPSEQANADAIVAAAAQQITLAKGLQEVARTGDTAAITAYTEANQPKLRHAQKLAGDYGLKVCGSGR